MFSRISLKIVLIYNRGHRQYKSHLAYNCVYTCIKDNGLIRIGWTNLKMTLSYRRITYEKQRIQYNSIKEQNFSTIY